MKKVLKFLLYCMISFWVVWLSGYGIWEVVRSPGYNLFAMFGATVCLSSFAFVIQEMKLKHTREIEKLSDQLVLMEAQRKELKAEIDVLTNRIEQLEANEMDNK